MSDSRPTEDGGRREVDSRIEAARPGVGDEAPDGPPGVVQVDARRAPWRHPALPLLAGAAAAGLILYFALVSTESADPPAPVPAPQTVAPADAPGDPGSVADEEGR